MNKEMIKSTVLNLRIIKAILYLMGVVSFIGSCFVLGFWVWLIMPSIIPNGPIDFLRNPFLFEIIVDYIGKIAGIVVVAISVLIFVRRFRQNKWSVMLFFEFVLINFVIIVLYIILSFLVLPAILSGIYSLFFNHLSILQAFESIFFLINPIFFAISLIVLFRTQIKGIKLKFSFIK